MPDTDLNLLTALDALLAEGSVAGAARRLGLSASAMSRTLARLREATGDPLLVRAGRTMVATPHAVELRERVHRLARETHAVLRPAAAGFDPATLQRNFTIRANEGFVEIFAARLIAAVAAAAPRARLRFAPKPDKDVRPLREGIVDLDIGVLGESGPEVRVQGLFRDHYVGVVRCGHPLLEPGQLTAERYAACAHVVVSRRGRSDGPVDAALAELGLARRVVAVLPGFRAALAVASDSDLVALATASFFDATLAACSPAGTSNLACFPLPVRTAPIMVSQMWHPQLDAEPAHRWLRALVLACCRRQAQ
ncbi:LysR family transcriptional regulator [Rhodanobacter sp. C06]|uniref:LysR family transcriptional regulator n=1 Tax=Rhodanobacter sp. C06 TaxID=1945854 RepID=UPI0009868F51|nr:LysR family transcriptional regulator [Rhodanobacter sp. C06]OOG39511.1 LysR family transcriptional regulator [Rhodanobacter sp. C06]